jgi:hypothetical protein
MGTPTISAADRPWIDDVSDVRRAKRYGLTVEEYWLMKQRCADRCEACGERHDRTSLYIDHDHATGAVRGLICNRCNTTLGRFGDNPEQLRRLAAYIENPPHTPADDPEEPTP